MTISENVNIASTTGCPPPLRVNPQDGNVFGRHPAPGRRKGYAEEFPSSSTSLLQWQWPAIIFSNPYRPDYVYDTDPPTY